MKFMGYARPGGKVGVRNYVGVISVVGCANEVTIAICHHVRGTTPVTHTEGCLRVPSDLQRTQQTLINLGKNPNLAAVLLVSLGCESVFPNQILEEVAKTGKPVELIEIQKIGGSTKAIAAGVEIAAKMALDASELHREEFDASHLILSTKCGASDATSGLTSNLAVGEAAKIITSEGGTFLQGEVCDIMGFEQELAKKAVDPVVGQKIIDEVNGLIDRGNFVGANIVGCQLTEGNKRGGLTTVAEKAIGATVKGNDLLVQGFIDYGELLPDTAKGRWIIPTPGHGMENLTGCAAAGSQLMVFTTGLGAPEGHPIMPVIKVTGNINTWNRLQAHMDVEVSGIIEATETIEEAGQRLFQEVLKVASGKLTKAEILHYDVGMNILTYGPII